MLLLTHMEHALDVLVEALNVRLVHRERLAHHAAGLVDGHAAQLALVRLPVLVQQQQQLLGWVGGGCKGVQGCAGRCALSACAYAPSGSRPEAAAAP